MAEHIVQTGPMLILAGLLVAWLAEVGSRAGGYGFMLDIAVALAGSVATGALVWALISSNAGMVAMLVTGCGGGALAIVAQRVLWRSARTAT
jgi:hypothetical protein